MFRSENFRGFSIRRRLTAWYSMAVALILTLLALLLYEVSMDIARRTNYDFMLDEARSLESMLADPQKNMGLLVKSVMENPLHSRDSLYSYYVRVLDEKSPHHAVFMETPGMAAIFPGEPVLHHPGMQIGGARFVWKHAGKTYFVMLVRHGRWCIQLLLDTSNQAALTHERLIFSVILLSGCLLAIATGFLVTRRGLLSLDALTETVRNITSGSLDQRIDPQQLPPELHKLGEAFNQMLSQIEDAFLRLKQMSDDMAHELKTPLSSLVMQMGLLLSGRQTEAQYREGLASSLEELQKIVSLVENILFLARADGRRVRLEKTLVDVRREIDKIVDFYAPLCEEKKISLTVLPCVMTDGVAPAVNANPVMFLRLMHNVISNAVKYTHEGGVIVIRIDRPDATSVRIEVEDNGIGISPVHLPHVFDRFYRADASRSGGNRGIGLGLAIAKSIVRLHGGRIDIDSTQGVGTRVSVVLDRWQLHEGVRRPSSPG